MERRERGSGRATKYEFAPPPRDDFEDTPRKASDDPLLRQRRRIKLTVDGRTSSDNLRVGGDSMDAIVPPSPLPPTPQRPRYLPAFARTLTTPVTVLAPSLSRPLEPSTTQTLAKPASVTLPPKPPYRDEEGDVGHQLGSASASDCTVEDIIKWQVRNVPRVRAWRTDAIRCRSNTPPSSYPFMASTLS